LAGLSINFGRTHFFCRRLLDFFFLVGLSRIFFSFGFFFVGWPGLFFCRSLIFGFLDWTLEISIFFVALTLVFSSFIGCFNFGLDSGSKASHEPSWLVSQLELSSQAEPSHKGRARNHLILLNQRPDPPPPR